MMGDTEVLALSWDNYKHTVTNHLRSLMQDETFADVSLHCEGQVVRAHRVYLSACSEFFRQVLATTQQPWQHPVLFLSQVPLADLQKILEFIYCGEVQVTQKRLQSFLKSAEFLKISGLQYQNSEQVIQTSEKSHGRRKKRRKESIELTRHSTEEIKEEELIIDDSEQVIVKADPEDFNAGMEYPEESNDEESGANRGINVRSDLMRNQEAVVVQGPMYGERGRCHFCQLLCPDRSSLTDHLRASHQPPKHSLCENCENFFHICAITRHREKCKARYHTDR